MKVESTYNSFHTNEWTWKWYKSTKHSAIHDRDGQLPLYTWYHLIALQWRHETIMASHIISDSSFKSFFMLKAKKYLKLRILSSHMGNPLMTGGYPGHRACHLESVSVSKTLLWIEIALVAQKNYIIAPVTMMKLSLIWINQMTSKLQPTKWWSLHR